MACIRRRLRRSHRRHYDEYDDDYYLPSTQTHPPTKNNVWQQQQQQQQRRTSTSSSMVTTAKANGIIHRTTTHRHNTLKSWRRGAGAFASIPRAWRAPLWWKHATISGMGLQKKLLHPSVIPPSTQLRNNILRNPINVDGQA